MPSAFPGVDVPDAEAGLAAWLAAGCHGEMDYMAAYAGAEAGNKRAFPALLVPGTRSIITARMNYRPDAADSSETLADGSRAFVSRYALGRDYHKLLRASDCRNSPIASASRPVTSTIEPSPTRRR
jgi:epoxyqueuosine reductase